MEGVAAVRAHRVDLRDRPRGDRAPRTRCASPPATSTSTTSRPAPSSASSRSAARAASGTNDKAGRAAEPAALDVAARHQGDVRAADRSPSGGGGLHPGGPPRRSPSPRWSAFPRRSRQRRPAVDLGGGRDGLDVGVARPSCRRPADATDRPDGSASPSPTNLRAIAGNRSVGSVRSLVMTTASPSSRTSTVTLLHRCVRSATVRSRDRAASPRRHPGEREG